MTAIIPGDAMDLGLSGRTALLSAASRGFGRATALRLAGEGVKLALFARGDEDLQNTAAESRAAGAPAVLARPLDLADGQALAAFVQEARERLGPIDLLLVNAGGPPAGGFGELDLTAWEAAYRLTIESAVRLCRLVLPGMMARGWGRIVQITSVTVRQPVENLILSNVLRPAAHALARSLALEAAPRGVTVNSVAPGFHLTSAVERLIAKKLEQGAFSREAVLAAWESEIPLGRLGQPEELAALIVFLMSEPAGYITGQCIVADGGWVRGL